MSVGLRLTYAEYMRLVEEGAFDSLRDRRIELILGELRETMPPGPGHSEVVSRLNTWSAETAIKKLAKLRVQDPIGIPEADSAPEPDFVWQKILNPRDRYPLPAEVLLLIEVADSSLDGDCGEKADLYASVGIQDYWVVSLPERLVHVYRQPGDGIYAEHFTASVGDEIRPLALPQFVLRIADLLEP
jgi:Uma2 family endonuclease